MSQLRWTSLQVCPLTQCSELGCLQFVQTTLGRMDPCPHFVHEETEAPREEVTELSKVTD